LLLRLVFRNLGIHLLLKTPDTNPATLTKPQRELQQKQGHEQNRGQPWLSES
jgi:hypothetical protein